MVVKEDGPVAKLKGIVVKNPEKVDTHIYQPSALALALAHKKGPGVLS